MKIVEKLEREPYRFKDIEDGGMFFCAEPNYDPSLGNYERKNLYLKIKSVDEHKVNAILLTDDWQSGERHFFKKDAIVEYVEATIVIKEVLKDYPREKTK